jgi:hypothetical protein
MTATHVFSGIPVADFEAMQKWYQRLFGRGPDGRPHDSEAVWQLTETGLVYVVADRDRAGSALVTVVLDDLGAWLDELAARGVSAPAIESRPGGQRKAVVIDPEGNQVTFVDFGGD